MAFALTGFKAYGVRAEGAERAHVTQRAVFRITAANTDTALDIATAAGTFWTAALADSTYGSLASAVNSLLFNQISGILYQIRSISGLPTYVPVLTLSAGLQYTVSVTADIPSLAFNSGSAPTAYSLVVDWLVIDGVEAVVADFGSANT